MAIEDVVSKFKDYFSRWEITLPSEAVENRDSGMIVQLGWTVFFLFGIEDDVEYLDFYASHRMTNDRHHRFYADGREDWLDSYETGYQVGETAEETETNRREFYEYNRMVGKLLEEKGFVSGDAHASHNVNSWLARTPPEDRSDTEKSD